MRRMASWAGGSGECEEYQCATLLLHVGSRFNSVLFRALRGCRQQLATLPHLLSLLPLSAPISLFAKGK